MKIYNIIKNNKVHPKFYPTLINFRTVTTIAVSVLPRQNNVAVTYVMKSLTMPPGGKLRSERFYIKNGIKYQEKVNYKVVELTEVSMKNVLHVKITL